MHGTLETTLFPIILIKNGVKQRYGLHKFQKILQTGDFLWVIRKNSGFKFFGQYFPKSNRAISKKGQTKTI